MTEWQTMETAPTDGTPILVYATRFGWREAASRVCAAYNCKQWRIYGAANGEPLFRKDTQWLDVVKPTHWMPLPSPPDPERKEND